MKRFIMASAIALFSSLASATPFTSTSSSGLDVTTVGASTVGGIVVDLVGANGAHVVSQLAASSLFVGFYDSGTPAAYNGNPGTIGVQSGFGAAVTNALGGGLLSASFRFSLWDGDSAAGDFDHNANELLINGINFGNWSNVATQNTTGLGALDAAGSSFGFRNNTLDTGWFFSNNAATLNALFASLLSTEELQFQVQDNVNPFDNFFDFTQGIDNSLINVGQGPVVTPPGNVPEPSTMALLGLSLFGLAAMRRKKQA